jgi:hypothetical protein
MTIIDSQVHVYEANTLKRPWHSVPNWPHHVTGNEMVAAMDKVGVDVPWRFSDAGLRACGWPRHCPRPKTPTGAGGGT